jgi:hypothetical protein
MGIHAAVLQIRLVVGDWISGVPGAREAPCGAVRPLDGLGQVICSGPPSHLTGEFDRWATFNGLEPPELFDSPWRSDRTVDLNWEAAISCAQRPG